MPGNVDEKILTDRNRLMQILVNLTGNAVKFTFSGSVKLKIQKDEFQDGKIWFSVEDTGIGISEVQMEELFTINGKLEDYQKINTQGAGFGLTISNNLVSLLNDDDPNCNICIESKPNIGTRVSFFLQNVKVEQDKLMRESTFESINSEPSPKKILPSLTEKRMPFDQKPSSFQRTALSPVLESPQIEMEIIPEVLVVDDNSFNLIIAKRMIERKGLKVVCAYHGKEAIEIMHQRRNDVKFILMDCQMPIMDGYEALGILKGKMSNHELPKIPIYLLSAKNYETVVEELRGKAVMDGYIMKPLTDAELQKVLLKYNLLPKRRNERQLIYV
jgi:CheY-like chemotaxis protein